MKLAKVPKVGDILKFKSNYVFNRDMNYYSQQATITNTSTGFFNNANHLEIPKDTLVEVVEVVYQWVNSGMSDEVDMNLTIAVTIEDQPEFFGFRYSLHKSIVEVIEASKAIKLLYGDK
jgi:hypothetical protein